MSEQNVQISKEEYHQLLSLKEELAQLKRMLFGKKNERFIARDNSQTHLDFLDNSTVASPDEVPQETIQYSRAKKQGQNKAVRLQLPAHLLRQEEILEPVGKQDDAVKIGQTVTEILEYIPGKLYVKRYVRPKYVQNDQVIIAPLPTLPIPQGNAGAGLLAYLLVSKFADHLPFYRQVQIFKREGVKLAESTIAGWFKAVCKLLEPLYYELQQQILSSDYLMADETPLPVQSSQTPGATHTGYHWVYRSVHKRLVIFDYQKGRGAIGPKTFLKNYQGAIQSDGYVGYEWLASNKQVTLLACWAHARRKFEKALDNDHQKASFALENIQALYRIERDCTEQTLNTDEIYERRQQEAVPILKTLSDWMQQTYPSVALQSSIGKAISYAMNLWPRLIRYTENGAWNIDNNLVENSIRPVALGRKNYLFAGSHDAAQHAAMIYSFLGTCKLNEIEPLQWLRQTIEVIPDTKMTDLHKLLPIKTA